MIVHESGALAPDAATCPLDVNYKLWSMMGHARVIMARDIEKATRTIAGTQIGKFEHTSSTQLRPTFRMSQLRMF